PADIGELVEAATADHYAGWRLRHVRPSRDMVTGLADAWMSGQPPQSWLESMGDREPATDPDGSWPGARTDLVRLGLTEPDRSRLTEIWPTVPGATAADFAYVSGQLKDAVYAYRTELDKHPDDTAAWAGLGVSLS